MNQCGFLPSWHKHASRLLTFRWNTAKSKYTPRQKGRPSGVDRIWRRPNLPHLCAPMSSTALNSALPVIATVGFMQIANICMFQSASTPQPLLLLNCFSSGPDPVQTGRSWNRAVAAAALKAFHSLQQPCMSRLRRSSSTHHSTPPHLRNKKRSFPSGTERRFMAKNTRMKR